MEKSGDGPPYVFRSAASLYFYACICLIVVPLLGLFALMLLLDDVPMYVTLLRSSSLLAVAVGSVLIYHMTRYIVTEGKPIIKFPLLPDEHIPLGSIASIKRVYAVGAAKNPSADKSSPILSWPLPADLVSEKALSTDRLEIRTYGKYGVYISPKDPDRFIGIIKANMDCLSQVE